MGSRAGTKTRKHPFPGLEAVTQVSPGSLPCTHRVALRHIFTHYLSWLCLLTYSVLTKISQHEPSHGAEAKGGQIQSWLAVSCLSVFPSPVSHLQVSRTFLSVLSVSVSLSSSLLSPHSPPRPCHLWIEVSGTCFPGSCLQSLCPLVGPVPDHLITPMRRTRVWDRLTAPSSTSRPWYSWNITSRCSLWNRLGR